ncbi:hypothetical protein ABPG75_009538 [Micractinium tetrahymenae]
MTTVLGRLVGGGPPGDQQGQDGKLLELADTREEQETVPGAKPMQGEAMASAADEAALASVITQVPRDQQAAPPPPAVQYAEQQGEEGSEVRSNWKNKFRSTFCCLAPSANAQYVRQEEGPVVIRPIAPQPPSWTEPVLGPLLPQDVGKKTLVLDLDETLVHSSFKPVPQPDYIIPVEIEGRIVDVYVLKRPFVDHFLRAVGSRFEVVVFTASLGKYADPLLDLLDKANVVRWRLFREACYPYEGSYVKDLQCLGRDLGQTIIVDNSPHSYMFQPENALPIGTFIDDMQDQELLDCLDLLLAVEKVEDVRAHLGPILARKQAGLIASFTQAVGNLAGSSFNMLSGGRTTPSDNS